MTDPKPDDLADVLYRALNGLGIADPAERAEHFMRQWLDGRRHGREQVKAGLAAHFAVGSDALERLTKDRDEAVAELQKLRGEQDTGAQPIPPPAVDRVARLVFQREYDNSAEAFDRLAAEVDAGMQHSGDCTKESHTCHVCQIAEVRKASREYIAASSAHPPEVVRLIEAARHLVNMFCGDGDPAWQGEAIQEVIDALTPFGSETGS